ncbi:MAG: DUF1194 domain-containing protein [Parvibaculaceae bacterium]
MTAYTAAMRRSPPDRHGLRKAAASALFALAVSFATPARAEGLAPVAVELVLAVDCSYSVNDVEYGLQMRGIAAAFRDPEVVALIGDLKDGVAVSLFHWASTANNKQAVPWRLLTDAASIHSFAAEVERAPRSRLGYFTAIGHAINYGVKLLETNAFAGRQSKIDISGDGRSNAGPEPDIARLAAFARGITINGLAVLSAQPSVKGYPSIADYYAQHVVIGPSSFVIKVESYNDFGAAMKRKLLRELGPQVAMRN